MWGGIKSFIGKPAGKVALVVLTVVTLVGSFLYLGVFLAIPTFLLFGLAIPIYTGWKRPRTLALAGLAVLLVSAPLASLVEAQALRAPSPSASSDNFLPTGNGGSVLQNARVDPFTGSAGGTFTWTVTVNPAFVPKGWSTPESAALYVSTCPGATGNSSPYCNPGYSFVYRNYTFPANTTTPQTVTFTTPLHGVNIWWWQMSVTVRNATGGTLYIFLDPGNSYNGVQGPVTGDFTSTFGIVLPNIFIEMLFYQGSVFFFALLVYILFKNRERRRKAEAEAMMMGPSPGAGPPPAIPGAGGPPSTGPAAPKVEERSCPNCGAVVYPNEKSCWKCGTLLTPPAAAPLPSQSP